MHVLVTGADGFVGRALVEHLAGRGARLTAATRAGPAGDDGRLRRVAVGDMGHGVDWTEALEGVDAVVHAAGRAHVSPRSAAEREAALTVNRDAAVSLYEAAGRAGVRIVVVLSSITVLGGRTAGKPLRDDAPFAPQSFYAETKRDAEVTLAARRAVGPPLVVLRPPLVAGRGPKGNLRSLLALARTPFPLPLGGLANRRTLLSLPNLAGAVERVLDHPDPGEAAGTYNLGDARPVSTSDMVVALRRGLGRPPRLLPVPSPVARLLGGRGGIAGRLCGDLEVSSDRFRERFGHSDVTTTVATLEDVARSSA